MSPLQAKGESEQDIAALQCIRTKSRAAVDVVRYGSRWQYFSLVVVLISNSYTVYEPTHWPLLMWIVLPVIACRKYEVSNERLH